MSIETNQLVEQQPIFTRFEFMTNRLEGEEGLI